jgi:hypothetical protein
MGAYIIYRYITTHKSFLHTFINQNFTKMQTQEVLTDVIDMSQSARNYALGTVCDAEEHEDAVDAVIEDYMQGAREMYVKLTTFVNVNDAVPTNNYPVIAKLANDSYAIATFENDMWSVDHIVAWRKLHI